MWSRSNESDAGGVFQVPVPTTSRHSATSVPSRELREPSRGHAGVHDAQAGISSPSSPPKAGNTKTAGADFWTGPALSPVTVPAEPPFQEPSVEGNRDERSPLPFLGGFDSPAHGERTPTSSGWDRADWESVPATPPPGERESFRNNAAAASSSGAEAHVRIGNTPLLDDVTSPGRKPFQDAANSQPFATRSTYGHGRLLLPEHYDANTARDATDTTGEGVVLQAASSAASASAAGGASAYAFQDSSQSYAVDGAASGPRTSSSNPGEPATVPPERDAPQAGSIDENQTYLLLSEAIATGVTKYARAVPARRPCCCASCGILLVCGLCALGMIFMGMEVETNFDAFMKTDINSSVTHDGFKAALAEKNQKGRRLQSRAARLYQNFDVFIAYELKEGSTAGGIFDSRVIAAISSFEKRLVEQPAWKAYCDTVLEKEKAYCTTGLSVVNFVLPTLEVASQDVVPNKLTFDGAGRDPIPLATSIQMIKQHEDLQRILFPTDFASKAVESTSVARSAFRFKFYCCDSSQPLSFQSDQVREFNKVYMDFVEETMLPFLQRYSPGGEESEDLPVNIYFSGTRLKTLEVMQTLQGDIRLAAGSLGFVLFYTVVHTRSIFLGITGLFLCLLAVPFSYVIFAVIAGTTKMSIASFLSLFLVIGLGSDVIFVYTDFWRASVQYHTDLGDRVQWTQKNAGKASLATSATTALSFFANLASVLRPLREFGTFMGLCVVVVWALVTFLYLPLCIVNENCFEGERQRSIQCTSASISSVLVKWETYLVRWKKSCLFVSALFMVLALFFAATNATTDTSGMPNLFPKNHNQGHGTEVMQLFATPSGVFDPHYHYPPNATQVCQEWRFDPTSDPECLLFWCEAVPNREKRPEDVCTCWRKETKAGQTCPDAEVEVVSRFVGGPEVSMESLSGLVAADIEQARGLSIAGGGVDRMEVTKMAPLILQEWLSGAVAYDQVTQVKAFGVREVITASCGWQEICFCGTSTCRLGRDQAFIEGRTLNISNISRAPALPRTLSAVQAKTFHTLPHSQRADIFVVFGIIVEPGSPLLGEKDKETLWRFQENYEAAQPWAQRNVLQMCEDIPAVLRPSETTCWIEDFRKFLTARGERFPVHAMRFDDLLAQFLEVGLTGAGSTKNFFWIRDGKATANYLAFAVDFSRVAEVEAVLQYKEHWNKHLVDYNAQASRFALGVFHTSSLWVRAEAQEQLISSTITTLAIVVLLAYVGMLVFTFDPLLSLLVVMSTIGVVSGLAFFIICIMQWPIGPVEVIALIVFIGYAVTYSLHITHKYGDDEALNWEPIQVDMDMDERAALRYRRTGFAMKSIGGAALGSAITTCGCSAFLIGCTLTIFQKLGCVVLVVTIMSIGTALGPLPAALLVCGPLEPGRTCVPCLSRREPEQSFTTSSHDHQEAASPNGGFRAHGPQQMGDGVILATTVVGQDARSRRPSWQEYVSKPYSYSYTASGKASRVPPGAHSASSSNPHAESPPTSVDAVHIDISDRDFDVAEGESVAVPVQGRAAWSISSRQRTRTPQKSRIISGCRTE